MYMQSQSSSKASEFGIGLLSGDKAKAGIELCKRIQQSLNGLIRKMNYPNPRFRIPDSETRSTK
jgi:hypothetical protein